MSESSTESIFRSPDDTAKLIIRIWEITPESSGSALLQERVDELLGRARSALAAGVPDPYQWKSTGRAGPAVTDDLWYANRSEYLLRERTTDCVQDTVEIIATSNSVSHAIQMTAWICQENLNTRQSEDREKTLESFREVSESGR